MPDIPISVPKKLAERVLFWDDERSIGNSLIVSLKPGWRFINTECHTCGEDNVKAMTAQLRATTPCDCDECVKMGAAQPAKEH